MNTQCTPEPMRFSSLNSQKVQADFDGGTLTSDAGALLLREVDRRIGLIDALNACLADPRDGRYTIHDQRSMLAQRIFGIAAGYEDLNDHAMLRDDPNEAPEDRGPRPIQRSPGRFPLGLGLSPPGGLPKSLRPADGPSEPLLDLGIIPHKLGLAFGGKGVVRLGTPQTPSTRCPLRVSHPSTMEVTSDEKCGLGRVYRRFLRGRDVCWFS